MSPLSRGRTRNKQNPNPETLRHLFSEHKWMPCGFASAIGSSVGGWSYWLWKQPGHQVDHTPFSGVNEQLEGSRLSRTPGVSVVVGVEKRLPGWGSLFKDGLRSCKGSGLWLLGNVSSLNGDELTMRTTLQDDKGEEGDVQEDRRGWIGQLLARENGTKQSPRAPHPCSWFSQAGSRCLLAGLVVQLAHIWILGCRLHPWSWQTLGCRHFQRSHSTSSATRAASPLSSGHLQEIQQTL